MVFLFQAVIIVEDKNNDIKTIAECWDELSDVFDEEHNTENTALWKEQLSGLLGKAGDQRVLDIGTGTGFLAIMLSQMGFNVTGVDVSEKMLSTARSKACKSGLEVDFRKVADYRLPYEDGYFDCIVNSRLLWTLVSPEETFYEGKRVLKPGGKVLSFMRPSGDTEKRSWCYGDEFEEKLTLKYMSESRIADIFLKCGFKGSEILYLPESISTSELPGWYCIICEK